MLIAWHGSDGRFGWTLWLLIGIAQMSHGTLVVDQ
jgi:hypothetical protein